MPRGGARPGAGRPLGGRLKLTNAAIEEAKQQQVDPLVILLAIANDPHQSTRSRMIAAAQACPYIHPRVSLSMTARLPSQPAGHAAERVAELIDRFAGGSLIEGHTTVDADMAPVTAPASAANEP